MPVERKSARIGTEQRHFDSLAQEAYLNLWRSYDRLRGVEDELFSSHDLTPQQYNVLRLLRGVHPATIARESRFRTMSERHQLDCLR